MASLRTIFIWFTKYELVNTFHFVNEDHYHNEWIFLIDPRYNHGPHAQITLWDILVNVNGNITYSL